MNRPFYGVIKGYSYSIITLLFICLLANRVLPQSADAAKRSPDFVQYKNEIVATIGDVNLTAQEFLFNYEYGPAFLKRIPQSKKKYLDLMIYEKLLAIDGYQKGLHKKESVLRSLKAYEEDIVTEELFKEEVMDQVFVTDEEIERVLPMEQKNLSLRWLYADTEQSIIEQWHALQLGQSFDSLFQMQLNDTVSIDDRSMESTLYRLQIKNPILAAIIDTISSAGYTNPIKVSDGWYLIKIDNIWTDLITTETELNKLKHELERSIFKQKLDVVSDIYINNMMDTQLPQINRDIFKEAVYYINQIALYPDSFDRGLLDKKLQVESDHELHSYDASGESVLVNGRSCKILLGEFIDWYRPRMAYLEFSSNSVEAFILSVNRTVWRMVRDHLLIQRARELGLDQREGVETQIKWWRDKIVFNAVKSEIATSIEFDKKDLENYYNANRRDYRYKNGSTIPFEKALGNVRSDYIREKYMSQLIHRVLELKQVYNIHIDETVLDNIEVEEEANPDAIDFYVVKKGGLLPRQPYPTIDWEWQQWY